MTIPKRRSPVSGPALLGLAAVLIAPACHRQPRATTTPARAEGPRPECVSLLGRPLYATPPGHTAELERKLQEARAARHADPGDPDKLIWVGRRLGYLWRMNEAIAVYTEGIQRFPDYAPLYRHRGHRYISIRKFAEAERDLEKAAELIEGKPDVIEQDGMPNAKNIPLTTLGFNVWYHLGLARYLLGDYRAALDAYRQAMKHTRGYDDNRVAVTYWMYLILERTGRRDEAAALVAPIAENMNIIENFAYRRLLLLYSNKVPRSDVLDSADAGALDSATSGYGLARHIMAHRPARANEDAVALLERVVDGPYWPAFGYIAAEEELAHLNAESARVKRQAEGGHGTREGSDQ